jgi:hypothetical protein
VALKAVIGLRLCPFAERVHRRVARSATESRARVCARPVRELADELRLPHAADPLLHETSLLIHPHGLEDFDDYNQS